MSVLIFVFLAVLIAGVPVFIALAGSSLLYTHFLAGIPDFVILHRMAGGIDSFPLLAVPFFILAGNLMNSAGITNRIFDFAVAIAGWMRGGLGHVNIIGSVIFAGMSGTAIADAAGLGTIEIKAMKDHGYDTEFAVGVTAASATLGPIIPPSLPFVIYGMMANVSIGALFLGGIVPGAVMTVLMMLYVTYYARRHGIGRDQVFRWGVLATTFVAALPALLTPAIIIGGMTFGWFTPTEAAIAACAWALILGVFLYRSLSLKQFYKVTLDTIETTAAVLLIVGAASLFGWVLTVTKVTEQVAAGLLSISSNPYVILLIVNRDPAGRRLLSRADRLDQHPCAGADAGAAEGRHRPGPLRRGHDAELDDRAPASPARHGAVRAGEGVQAVDRAGHHGHPALARSPDGFAARHHADPGADALAAPHHGLDQIGANRGLSTDHLRTLQAHRDSGATKRSTFGHYSQ